MAKLPSTSPSQVIFRNYPDAFLNIANAIVRVRSITNVAGEERNSPLVPYVLERIAQRISEELKLRDTHQQEARQRRRKLATESTEVSPEEDALFDSIFGDESMTEELEDDHEILSPTPVTGALTSIRPQRLSFVLINEDATLRTRVFPRTFHCQNCGHFMAIDSSKPPSNLQCPCCHNGLLRQEAIVFACARCASVRELTPKGKRFTVKSESGEVTNTVNEQDPSTVQSSRREPLDIKEYLGKIGPSCPDCTEGHIHLEKHATNIIERWEWRCTNCSHMVRVEEQCLNCALRKTDDKQGSLISMPAFPATATGALTPLIDVQIFVGNQPLNPHTLHTVARKAGQSWPDYFELQGAEGVSTRLDAQAFSRLEEACIANAYLLRELSVVNTVYGYRAGPLAQHGATPVEPDQRQARFFPDPEKIVEYMCYGMINSGAALVIEFNQQKILSQLAATGIHLGNMTYQQVVERERALLSDLALRDILQKGVRQLPLFSALHAVEHALLTSAQRLVGNEVFGSVLFLEESMLVIYERETIQRGGVVQVVNGGSGLVTLLEAAGDHVSGCAQGCAEGCPSCIYVSDSHCHYNHDDLKRAWLPSNALLSRTGARLVLVPNFA